MWGGAGSSVSVALWGFFLGQKEIFRAGEGYDQVSVLRGFLLKDYFYFVENKLKVTEMRS